MWKHRMEGKSRFTGSYDYVKVLKGPGSKRKFKRYFVLYKCDKNGNIISGIRSGTFSSPQQAKNLGWKKV